VVYPHVNWQGKMPGGGIRKRRMRTTGRSAVRQISNGESTIVLTYIIRNTEKRTLSMLPRTGNSNKNAIISARQSNKV